MKLKRGLTTFDKIFLSISISIIFAFPLYVAVYFSKIVLIPSFFVYAISWAMLAEILQSANKPRKLFNKGYWYRGDWIEIITLPKVFDEHYDRRMVWDALRDFPFLKVGDIIVYGDKDTGRVTSIRFSVPMDTYIPEDYQYSPELEKDDG